MLGLFHRHLGYTWRLGREHQLKKRQSCTQSREHKFENLILLLLAGANNSDPAARFRSASISIGRHAEDTPANMNEELINSGQWEKHQHRLQDGNTEVKLWFHITQKERETLFVMLRRHLEPAHSSHSVLQSRRHQLVWDENTCKGSIRPAGCSSQLSQDDQLQLQQSCHNPIPSPD